MKKVSVIIPCHNAAKWLPQCFLSLVQQSIGIDGLELIFVDDASDDEGATWALLEEFERAYPESIMIIHLEENLRQGGARNVALGYATGEYLAFVDADDFVEKDFLEKGYRRAMASDADIVPVSYTHLRAVCGTAIIIISSIRRPIPRGTGSRRCGISAGRPVWIFCLRRLTGQRSISWRIWMWSSTKSRPLSWWIFR